MAGTSYCCCSCPSSPATACSTSYASRLGLSSSSSSIWISRRLSLRDKRPSSTGISAAVAVGAARPSRSRAAAVGRSAAASMYPGKRELCSEGDATWKLWENGKKPKLKAGAGDAVESGYENDYGGDGEPLLRHSSTTPIDWGAVSLLFLFPALGGLLFGYDIGATSGASISLTSPELSGTQWYDLASWQTGLVVSGSLYGALLGSILAFNIADFLGRRRELIVASLIYGVGAVITAVATNYAVLVIGRLLFGVGIGLAMHAAPMYIAETSPPKVRGTLISLKEAFIVLGMLLGYLVGSVEIDNVGGWRIMYGAALPIALVMGVGVWWLPPSPRWLLLCAVQGKGNVEELKERAAASIRRCGSSRANDEDVQEQLDDTLSSLGGGEEITFVELFQGLNLKALTVGAGLVFFQQVTGQPSVLYYAAPIFQSAGFSAAADATKLSVLLGFFKLLMTGIAVFNVDKLGRRPLLISGVSGIVVSLLLLAGYYSFAQGFPILAVVALLLYVGCYQVSFGPVSWLMVSEIFPLRSRGRALSLTTLVNFASNAVVAFAFAPLQAAVGASVTFLIFGAIGVGSLAFIVISVPETKGLTLEEIEAKLLGTRPDD